MVMYTATLARLVRAARQQVTSGTEVVADDALLGRWVEQADQSAFELLLWRHGPMVWQTCRRVLRHEQEAEDAFQATFLTLARKASSIRRAPCLAGWLYRVAHRAALAARARIARCVTAADLEDQVLAPGADHEDWREWLDHEVQLLPAKYREPFVLCYLEGRSTEEAAGCLGCPRNTVGTRLAWARQRLKDRLERRGVGLPACLVPLAGTLPRPLVETALQTVSAWTAHAAVTPAVLSLCEEVIGVMCLNKIKSVGLWLAPLFVLTGGAGWWLGPSVRADKPAKPDKPAVKPVDKPVKPVEKPAKPDKPAGNKKGAPADLAGIVQEVSGDGKTVTVALGGKNKGEEAKTSTLALGDKTEVLFTGIGLGEAQVRKGYRIQAWLAEGSKDTYARALFAGPLGKGPPPAVSGLVSDVARDGKSFTVTLPGKKSKKGEEEEKAREVTIRLGPKTSQLFAGVGPGEAKLVKGLQASVWLARGSKDTASLVHFSGSAKPSWKKGEGTGPQVVGQIVEVAKDGKAFVVQIPPKAKGEEPTKSDVKLGPESKVVFTNVGPGEAAVRVGYLATVWSEDKKGVTLVSLQGSKKSKQGGLAGEVSAVANDGKSFTIHLPPDKKGEEGKDVEVKLAADTRVMFNNVGPGGARITKGYRANVSLEEDAKDTATFVVFSSGSGK
jgi:RNA polymerase sigma factor (sigma-70 family)